MDFKDFVTIKIKSGAGGDGCVSFRREKYVPNGGPDGGDGGDGGDIVFIVDEGLNSLSDFRRGRTYKAESGEPGRGSKCHGKKGKSLYIKVPKGTVIKELSSDKIMADMSGDNTETILLKGGKGGLGNQHFATSRMQAPKYAKPGEDAKELEISLELKLIADVGLVGFPNAGKSTLLSVMSNAKPKIANYPFTTITPMLGVVDIESGDSFVMADIPGLIEGASAGVGLGHDFLRHIERTRLLIHLVDISGVDGRDPVESIVSINNELKSFSEELASKPQIIVLNKTDTNPLVEDISDLVEKKLNQKPLLISAVTGDGILQLKNHIIKSLEELPKDSYIYEPDYEYTNDFTSNDYEITLNDNGEYEITGPKIEKMMGYTNLESEKGFLFFTKFIKEEGIEDALINAGATDGDTVIIYDYAFTFTV